MRTCGRVALLVAPAVALLGAAVVRFFGWRGPDIPAQVYRVSLFRSHGWVLWDNGWYAGHYQLPYSVLFPPLGALLGLYGAAALSAAVAAWAFGEAHRRIFRATVDGAGDLVRVGYGRAGRDRSAAVPRRRGGRPARPARGAPPETGRGAAPRGRVPTHEPGRRRVPHARAHGVGARDPRTRLVADRAALVALVLVTAAPLLVLRIVFPSSGPFPFLGIDLVLIVAICAIGFMWLPEKHRAVASRSRALRSHRHRGLLRAQPDRREPRPPHGELRTRARWSRSRRSTDGACS